MKSFRVLGLALALVAVFSGASMAANSIAIGQDSVTMTAQVEPYAAVQEIADRTFQIYNYTFDDPTDWKAKGELEVPFYVVSNAGFSLKASSTGYGDDRLNRSIKYQFQVGQKISGNLLQAGASGSAHVWDLDAGSRTPITMRVLFDATQYNGNWWETKHRDYSDTVTFTMYHKL